MTDLSTQLAQSAFMISGSYHCIIMGEPSLCVFSHESGTGVEGCHESNVLTDILNNYNVAASYIP